MITLYNYGSETIQYELSHLPAETVHELSIETREVKIKNRAQYKVKSSDKDLDDVMFVKADAEVEFPSRVVSVPAGGQRRVAVKISPPKDLSADQHWVYSGFIVIRALSSPSTTVSGDNNTASPSEAIHVPYAGVKGKMRSLPIFLRPTEEELQVNNQTVYCQVLGSSLANKTEYIYSFEGMDVPILSYCIANPTKFLIIDLISGGEDSQSSNAPQVGDYQVLGRVGFEELLPRSPPQTIVSAIQWDGTIEIGEGSNSETPRTVGSREIVHHEPGMDLLYRMRPKAEGYDRSGASYTDSHFEKIVQRDIEEENTEKGKGKGYGDDMANKKEASPKSKKKALKQHLFRGHKKTEGEESVQVPDGRYRLRLRALRMLGDIDNSDDYDVWITPTFTIQRADPAPGTASNGTTTSAGPASTAATLPSASKAPTP
ncbi:hypothetical protein BGX26_008949 [Mortierella sp. AD094]|nr:hypothetical protein BGX26_008949 [Mortierella sp. AD094]